MARIILLIAATLLLPLTGTSAQESEEPSKAEWLREYLKRFPDGLETKFVRQTGWFYVLNARLQDRESHLFAMENLRPERESSDLNEASAWRRFVIDGHNITEGGDGAILRRRMKKYTREPFVVSHASFKILTVVLPQGLPPAGKSSHIDLNENADVLAFWSSGEASCFSYANAGTIDIEHPVPRYPNVPTLDVVRVEFNLRFDHVADEMSVTHVPPYETQCLPFNFEETAEFYQSTVQKLE